MKNTIVRLSASSTFQKKCFASLALKNTPNRVLATSEPNKATFDLFQPHLIFRKGKPGTFHGFLRAQSKRHDDKLIWHQIILIEKYGPYYDGFNSHVHSSLPSSNDDPDANYWRSIAALPNIYEALQRLVADERLNLGDHPLFSSANSLYLPESGVTPANPPTWLSMHLIANRVCTTRQATLAFDFALNQLKKTKPTYRFPLVLLAAHRLLKFSQAGYLAKHYDEILGVVTATPEFHYNELLLVCARFPKDDVSQGLVLKTLTKMKSLSVPVNKHVAQQLLLHANSSTEIAKLLPKVGPLEKAWTFEHKPRYHVARTSAGAQRRRKTAEISKMTTVEALRALGRRSDASPNIKMDNYEWSALISAVGRDPTVTIDALRVLWEKIKQSRGKNLDIASQTAIMDAFRQRGYHDDALAVWESILSKPATVDKRALMAAVMSLCGAGRYKDAFDTLDFFAFKNFLPSDESIPSASSRAQWVEQRGRIKLDAPMINAIMDRLNRGGRPDAVFKIWDVMEKYYCVWPDGITMTILLDAARRSSLIDPTMELALGQLGIFNPFKRFWARKQLAETPSSVISKLLEKPPESGFWHGDWAFINARAIFRDAVLGNWPHLKKIECPVGAYTPRSVSDRLWTIKDPSPELRWPTIIPLDKTFHAYIFLLGWNELQAEIPLALAWMRALQIEPMHRTLCAALMYFGEVSRLPPMFEAFDLKQGQEYGGDYGQLRRWIADWVGESALPSENMVAAYRRGDGQQNMRWYGRKY